MPAPPLPDTPRVTSYDIVVAIDGPFDVGFDIYGSGTDFRNWVEVWLDGVKLDTGWALASETSPDLSILPRPITDGVIWFDDDITGELVIVGAQRPRRTTQFTEGQAVSARAHNMTYTGIITMIREMWDKFARTLTLPGGETFTTLPAKSDLASKYLAFDSAGNPIASAAPSGGAAVSSFGATLIGAADAAAARAIMVVPPALATPVSMANGGTGAALVDPNTDRLLFWDDSAGAMTFLTLAAGIEISGTTLRVLESFTIPISDETTAITTGTAKVTWRMPYAFTVTAVRASLNTVSSSGIPTFDINEAGTTILSTKLTIDATEKTSVTAATAVVISDANLADDAEMTIDVDTAGTGAKGAKIVIIGYRP